MNFWFTRMAYFPYRKLSPEPQVCVWDHVPHTWEDWCFGLLGQCGLSYASGRYILQKGGSCSSEPGVWGWEVCSMRHLVLSQLCVSILFPFSLSSRTWLLSEQWFRERRKERSAGAIAQWQNTCLLCLRHWGQFLLLPPRKEEKVMAFPGEMYVIFYIGSTYKLLWPPRSNG
jgi:hypothetical protein